MNIESKSEVSAAELASLENGFMGHPKPLRPLFFTEMWERFSYYSIRPLLVLFMVATVGSGGFGFDEVTASAIYGIFAGSLYLAAVPGGWLAERRIAPSRRDASCVRRKRRNRDSRRSHKNPRAAQRGAHESRGAFAPAP